MTIKETVKRYVLMIIGNFLIALGVAMTRHSELGVTTISSVPNVISLKFTFLSVGTWLNIWNGLLILAQILLLGKNFKPSELLQILVTVLFGWFVDLSMIFVTKIALSCYLDKLMLVLAGIIIVGVGVSLSFISNVIMNPGEAIVRAIAEKFNKNIGNVKIVFDFFCVLTAVVLSLIFFNGKVVGVREGTIIAILCTGTIVKILNKLILKPLNDFLKK